jgi:hypothetical protein
LAKSLALTKATVPVFGERRVIRHRVYQSQPAEPAVGQIEMDFLTQTPLGTDPEAVADHQHANHQFRINRRPSDGAVERFHVLPEATQIKELIDSAKKMAFWNVILKAEGIEQLLATCRLTTHHGYAP